MAIRQYRLMADGNRRLAPNFKVRELAAGTESLQNIKRKD
jgi:hypothetical protein